MPTNKKSTNKTAHVLNVITAGKESGETPFTSRAPAAAPVSQPAAPFSNFVEVEHEPEELSDQIREALSQELARGEDDSFSAFQPESVQIGGSGPAAQTSASAAPPAAAARPASPVRQSALQSAPPSVEGQSEPLRQAAALHSGGPVPEQESDECEYINVMQALVDEKTPRYIQLLGVCPCSRCQADVKALALCHLEPKYIVIRKSQKFPYSVYENYYNAAVTSQIISACQIVKENPRH